jgi:hypothetical protein
MIVPLTNFVMVRAEDGDDGEISDSGDSGNSDDSGSTDSNSGGGEKKDDGYIYNSNDPDEQKQQDKDEKQMWEDAGRPGDTNTNDNNDNNDNKELSTCNDSDLRYHQRDCKTSFGLTCEKNNPSGDDACESDKPVTVRCSDGSTAEVQSMCPTKLSYCDTDAGKKATSCFDRKDIDQTTGLYPCNDGTQKADYKECKDITGTKKSNSNNNSNSPQQYVPDTPRTTPRSPVSQDCDIWGHTLDLKLADVNKRGLELGKTYFVDVDVYNAEVDDLNAEILRYNAECAT